MSMRNHFISRKWENLCHKFKRSAGAERKQAKVSCQSQSLKQSLYGSLCVSADTSWRIRKCWCGSVTEAVLQWSYFTLCTHNAPCTSENKVQKDVSCQPIHFYTVSDKTRMIVELQIFLFMVTGSALVFLTLRNAKTVLTSTKISDFFSVC